MLAIRAGGSAAGWAFQLQDPRTILVLMLLAIGITLNLLGPFTVPAFGGRARPSGGFATGALAAFVATPCAGPFLGTALGTALLLPPTVRCWCSPRWGSASRFPFVAIAFIPALRSGCRSRARGWRASALPCHPDGGDRGGLPVAVVARRRSDSAGSWASCGGGPGHLPDRRGPGAAQGPQSGHCGGDGRGRVAVLAISANRIARRSANRPSKGPNVERGEVADRCVRVIRCSSILPPTGA